jgi:hypothetical protein
VVDQFVIWKGGIGERHKQSTEQNTKPKNTNLTNGRYEIFLAFSVDLGMKTRNKLKDTQVYLTGSPKSDTT